jgi:parvulin-like peptidyl-prolyl isomerase
LLLTLRHHDRIARHVEWMEGNLVPDDASQANVPVSCAAGTRRARPSLACCSLAILACTVAGCISRSKDSGDAAVGRYQGGVVTASDLQREANRLPPALRQQFETQNGRREMVSAMIDKRLLAKEAEQRGYRDDPEIKRQVRELEERLTIQALLAAEERAAVPSEAEARAYYEAHRGDLAQPERVRLSRALARVEKSASQADSAKARARAEKFAARIRRGEPFAKVAAEGDGAEKAHGGDMGLIARGGTADRRLEEAAFGLAKPNAVSPVVQCDEGFAVIQVSERRPSRVPSFEEAKPEVENRLAPLRKRKVFDDLLARLRAKGEVQVEIASAPR